MQLKKVILFISIIVICSAFVIAQEMPQVDETRVLSKIGTLTLQNDVLNEYIVKLKARINELEIENKKLKEEK